MEIQPCRVTFRLSTKQIQRLELSEEIKEVRVKFDTVWHIFHVPGGNDTTRGKRMDSCHRRRAGSAQEERNMDVSKPVNQHLIYSQSGCQGITRHRWFRKEIWNYIVCSKIPTKIRDWLHWNFCSCREIWLATIYLYYGDLFGSRSRSRCNSMAKLPFCMVI